MQPNLQFTQQNKSFWAYVRFVSQEFGYAKKAVIIVPSFQDIINILRKYNFNTSDLLYNNQITTLGEQLVKYFEYRANVLNNHVQHHLMNAEEAAYNYNNLIANGFCHPTEKIPMNKQKGDKKAPAFLTAMVNMLIHANSKGRNCDYDPRKLTLFLKNGNITRTLARRVDGAYPAILNPIAIWEIKEYYYTTTFGSRVADGVYETLLDGLEIQEMADFENIDCLHYLIIDSQYTWWECGKSYLCRMIDMMHMGLVDEVIFGKEIFDRIPKIVRQWDSKY